jgi:hypothetical protein
MPFSRPISDRYFEDYIEGNVHCFGTIAVEADALTRALEKSNWVGRAAGGPE